MRRALILGATVLMLTGFTAAAPAPQSTPSKAPGPASATVAGQHQLVPAYFYPAGTNETNPWHILCRSMSKAGNGSIAIVNPDSGPGTFRNPPYVEALRYCHRHGQKVIGYVSTDYATRPLSATLSDVAKYYRWYRVDGIFLDEVSNFPTARAAGGMTVATYYARVHDRIKSERGSGRYVVANPGAPAATPWQLQRPIADTIVIFEDVASLYLRRRPPEWVLHRSANELGALVKHTPADKRHRVCAVARARNTGWIDVTSDGPRNTWDTLPPYFSKVAPRCR